MGVRFITLEAQNERATLLQVARSFRIKARMIATNLQEYELIGDRYALVEALQELGRRLGRTF